MLWPKRSSALVAVLLSAGLALLGTEAGAVKRKKPPQVQQDPMETESSPPPVITPPPEPPEKPAGEKDGGSGSTTTHPTHPTNSGGNSSGSAPPSAAPVSAPEKAGPFMFNVKIGPAFCVYPSTCAHEGSIVLDLGAALLHDRNGYLMLPLQFQFQPGGSAIMVPIGFQYDARLPLHGLYLYPRISVGYAAVLADAQPGVILHSGIIIPELGIKYILHGRWNFGGELVSLPLFLNSNGAQLYYRIHLSAGVNF